MKDDMSKRDDNWLDTVLATRPVVADDGFSAAVLGRIAASERRRRLVLAAAFLSGALIVAALAPWTDIFAWINSGAHIMASLTDTAASATNIDVPDAGQVTSWWTLALPPVVLLIYWMVGESR